LRRVDRHPHERLRRRTLWVDVSIGGEIDELEVVRIGGMPEALAQVWSYGSDKATRAD
jgi:hypothetical protein